MASKFIPCFHGYNIEVKRSLKGSSLILMEEVFIKRLRERDIIEKNFSYLFERASANVKELYESDAADDTIVNLKNELIMKEKEINQMKDMLKLQKKDTEKLNDEIISLNIENNLLQKQLQKLTEEYNELVDRWLKKVQGEADLMNQTLQ